MKVPVSMEAFMRLSAGEVVYEGPEKMIQYVVQSTKMELKNPKFLVVEVTLKRMFKYHLAATFVPTMLLMIVTELTLFVDEKHFEATIMVHLTTMLVMYTLYQGVSASMPKTANLKFIDIWLLYGLIVPFVTFVIETILRLLSTYDDEGAKAYDENERSSGKLIHVKLKNKTFPITVNQQTDLGPEKMKPNRTLRMKIKLVLQYASKILIPLTTLLFIVSYTIRAYTYYYNY
jgi:hypothetical protein